MRSRRSFPIALLLALAATASSARLAVSQPAAFTPDIQVEPSTTVEIGEEVLLDASATTYAGAGDLARARYEWDFGDDYAMRFGDPFYYSADSGIAVTHFYMRPGTFTATLTVSAWTSFDADGLPTGDPEDVITATRSITVTGQPPRLPPWPDATALLDMPLDGDLGDISASGLVAAWEDGAGSFVQGKAGQAADLAGAHSIAVADPAGVLDSLDAFTISFWAKRNTSAAYGTLLDKPGQFTVSILTTTIQASVTTENGTVAVADYLAREVNNTHWHHYAVIYDGGAVRILVDGSERSAEAHSGALAASTDSLLLGRRSTAAAVFDGLVDEVRIYDAALSTRDVSTAFELRHAPFHGRIAQIIYAQIPSGVYADPTNRLKVRLEGDNGIDSLLVERSNLAAEESFLLRNKELPAGNYVLTAQLLDAGDGLLDQIRVKFAKPYDGRPRIGIDENNAFIVDGEPFFALMPWMVDEDNMDLWRRYLNGGFTVGYYENDNISTWTAYLDAAGARDMLIIGPVEWEGVGPLYFTRNSDLDQLTAYVEATRDHDALFAWSWGDEQNMGSYNQRNPVQAMGAWAYRCHQLDPQHLVAAAQYGFRYLPYYGFPGQMQGSYNYLFSAESFGGMKHLVFDTFMFDVYPLEFHFHPALDEPERGMFAAYATAMDYAIAQNYGLVPVMSSVEAVNIWETDTQHPMPGPTPGQLRMLAWLNVVHGIKGVNWFLYREALRPPENFGVMAEFAEQITHLAPVVLGPETGRTITDTANTRGSRVDTLIRETEDDIYLFAVRLTEADFEQDRDGQPREAQTIDVAFDVGGLNGPLLAAEVFGQFESVWENKGTSAGGTTFDLTLDQAPIRPGSLIVSGLWPERPGRSVWLPAFDDGSGALYGELYGAEAAGTIDYETGQVHITFEEAITSGVASLRATYTPVRQDRSIPVVDGHFHDTFAREQVRIIRIPKELVLQGTPGDQAIYLNWYVHNTLPATSTWRIEYATQTATLPFTATDPLSATRAYTLTGLSNYQWYTVTLHAWVGGTSIMSDTIRAMPTNIHTYLPIVTRNLD